MLQTSSLGTVLRRRASKIFLILLLTMLVSLTSVAAQVAGLRMEEGHDAADRQGKRAESVDLVVAKMVNDPSPNEGDPIFYTIAMTNLGPSGATGVEVTDVLPPGVTLYSSSTTQGTYDAGPGVWALGALAGGASDTLTITAIVDAGTGGATIENTAAVTAVDQTDWNAANDSDSASFTVTSVDIALSKMVDDANPSEGDTVQYTVVVANLGPDDASGVEVLDLLPDGITFVSSNLPSYVYDAGTGFWAVEELAAGASDTLAITATVDAGTGGTTIVNTASLDYSEQTDGNAANDSDNATITVSASADLEIAKSVNNTAPNEGDTITYTVVVTNLGPEAASAIEITDLLPAGVTYQSDVPSKGTYDSGTGIWSVSSLPSPGSALLILSALVDEGTAGSTIVNTASVTATGVPDDNPANDSDDAVVAVPHVDLAVTKTVDDASPNEGATITYTIALASLGADAATGVELTDLLPAGVTFVSSTTTQGAYDDGSGVWEVDSIPGATADTLTITATVDAGTAGTTIENIATLTASDPFDSDPGNNSGSVSIAVPGIDLAVTKTVDDANPAEGATVHYTIEVTNHGPADATGVQVLDLLPGGVTFAGAVTSQGTYDEGSGVWTIGSIANAASDTLTLTVTIGSDVGGSTILNTAALTAFDQTELDPGNDSDSVEVTVPLVVGEVQVTSDASSDQRPAWSPDGNHLACDSDRSGNRDIWVVPATGGTPRQITTDLDIDQHPDWSPDLTQIAYSARLGSTPDIYLVPAVGGAPSIVSSDVSTIDRFPAWSPDGTQIAYTKGEDIYVVSASGGSPVQITTDPGLDVHPTWSPDGTMIAFLSNRSGNNDIWVIPASGGAPTQLTTDPANDGAPDWSPDGTRIAFQSNREGNHDIWVMPAAGGAAMRVTTHTASDVQPDWSPSGNKIAFTRNGDLWVATLAPSADLAVAKSVSEPTPSEGATISYTVILTNHGPAAAANVEVTDLLPPGVTYQSRSATVGDYDDQSGTWSLPGVSPGISETLIVTATVDAGTGSSTIVNVAAVTSSEPADVNQANDTDSAEIQVQQVVGVSGGIIPDRYALDGGRPSPFRESTQIRFDVPAGGVTTISVVDVTGRLVAVLLQRELEPGRYDTGWNGRDRFGRMASPGVYFVRMESGSFAATRKVVRLR